MNDKTPADVLEEAADLLLIHGRCTGQGVKGEKFCVRGAMAAARGADPTNDFEVHRGDSPDIVALDRHLAATYFTTLTPGERLLWEEHVATYGVFPSHVWNDTMRTEDDDFTIIDTLRSVAKDLRNEADQ